MDQWVEEASKRSPQDAADAPETAAKIPHRQSLVYSPDALKAIHDRASIDEWAAFGRQKFGLANNEGIALINRTADNPRPLANFAPAPPTSYRNQRYEPRPRRTAANSCHLVCNTLKNIR